MNEFKGLIATFFFFVFFSLPLYTQDHHLGHQCGYHSGPEEMERLEKNLELARQFNFHRSDDIYYMPLKIHLIARSDGSGRVSETDVISQMCILNNNYEPFNIQFFLKDGSINKINNTSAYNNASAAPAILFGHKDDRAINVYFAGTATESGAGGFVLGFYTPQWDWIVCRNDQVLATLTLSHEIGHFLSLQHTFVGWEPDPWREEVHGNPVTQVLAPDMFHLVELANGSNCNNAADRICDTPPDYNFGLLWDSDCPPFDLEVLDRNNDLVEPMQNNFMSYFFGCGSYEFSPTQVDVMISDFLSSNRDFLRDGFGTPTSGIITEDPDAISPEHTGESDYFDEVRLEWSVVDNATLYYLEVAYLPVFTEESIIESRFVFENEYTLTDLAPNALVYWRVRPLNDTYYCAGRSSTFRFRTSEIPVSVDGIEKPQFSFKLAENPSTIGNTPSLIIQNEIGTRDFVINVFSIDGKLIHSEQTRILNGSHKFRTNADGLKPGMYYVQLISEQINLVEQLIVQ